MNERLQGKAKPKPIVKMGKLALIPYGNRTYFFWKHFQLRFPCLAQIAHLVLQLPSSSAAIERTFSRISHQFDPNRSRLRSKTLLRLVQAQEQEKFVKILKSITPNLFLQFSTKSICLFKHSACNGKFGNE